MRRRLVECGVGQNEMQQSGTPVCDGHDGELRVKLINLSLFSENKRQNESNPGESERGQKSGKMKTLGRCRLPDQY